MSGFPIAAPIFAVTSANDSDPGPVIGKDCLSYSRARTEQIELSPDLKTLTRTVRPVGQREPNTLRV